MHTILSHEIAEIKTFLNFKSCVNIFISLQQSEPRLHSNDVHSRIKIYQNFSKLITLFISCFVFDWFKLVYLDGVQVIVSERAKTRSRSRYRTDYKKEKKDRQWEFKKNQIVGVKKI